ncbi:MAG: hypothetical protein HY322_08670 [Betaproteobacteria bacterium]|nr:hypothetical protein [Betaproteobacteria bacterium]
MVVIWVPEAGKFGRLVADGIFPGELQGTGSSLFGSDVHLGNLTPEHMVIITSEKHGVLFLWDRPLMYRRIARQ